MVSLFNLLHTNAKRFMVFCMLMVCILNDANAQAKKTRILFLMDASSSMTYSWQNKQNRFEAAANVVSAIIDSMYAVNNEVEFAVRIYGDQYGSNEKNCTDTRLIVPFNLQNLYQIKSKLKYIVPLGSSPIAYSLKEAAENELSNTAQYDYSFVLVTDGGESCGGDICEMYKKIVANKVKVAPYIIGLDTNRLLKNYYECLGQYVSVTTPKDIAEAARLIVNNNRPLLNKPKQLNIPEPIVVKKVVTPEPIFISDELTKITRMTSQASAVNIGKNPNAPKVLKYTYYLPPSITVTATPQLDALSPVPMIAMQKIAVSFTRVLSPFRLKAIKPKLPEAIIAEKIEEGYAMQKLEGNEAMQPIKTNTVFAKPMSLKNIGKPKLPEAMIAEKIEEGYVMQKLESNFAIQPIKTSIIFAKPIALKNIVKPNLPSEITEIPFVPIAMDLINLIKAPQNIAINSVIKNPKTRITPSILLPKEITEIPFVPQEMNTILLARASRASVITLDAKMGALRKMPNYTLPSVFTEPAFVPDKMEAVYAIPFRFSYTFAPPPSMLMRMRTPKQIAIPPSLIVKKAVPVKPNTTTEPTEFKVVTEPSNDTRIAVYFTDGFGKFYTNKPMVAIEDPATHAVVKKFMRDVIAGEPEPVKIDIDGIYDIVVLGQKDISLSNVPIEKNKLNKIYLKVTNGTLIFTYQNNRARPVNHIVKVWRRFSNKKTTPIEYPAMEQKMLEPGDYYVELDILPKYNVHTEISFGAITEVQIPQEGAMQIASNTTSGPVTLYYQNGDTYEEFMTLLINGKPESQRLVLRPGLYKASFVLPGSPKMTPPVIVSFSVKPNQETNFELKDYKDLMVTPDVIAKPIYINEKPKVDFINSNPLLDGNGKEKPRKSK
jgi:von Willebrand factor type A domain